MRIGRRPTRSILATDPPGGAAVPLSVWPGRSAIALALLGLVTIAMIGPALGAATDAPGLSDFFWRRQDWPVVGALGVLLLLLRRMRRGAGWHPRQFPPLLLAVAAAVLFLLAWGGHYVLLSGHDLSRDEQMVLFDADILTRGRLVAAMPAEWASLGRALNREFTMPLADGGAWVSAYLPGNAALHAAMARVGDAHMTAPLLAAIALLALADIARRLWPDDGAPAWIALGTLLLSAQFLVTAMTTYAMTAHLALNLLWLALFLRDRWWAYGAALLVGALATGLHQPIFHPLFVAPFLWWLIERRRWPVLGLLAGGYAVIGLFWLWWPGMVASGAGGMAAGTGGGLIERALDMIRAWKPGGLWLMALNLLRFAAWQHLLLLPLVAAGAAIFWRRDGFVRALLIGPVLTVAAMILLLPYQGHGWGYRYLHGLLGNFCLLAGFGWIALRGAGLDRHRLWQGSSAATLAAIAWLGWNAHAMVAPYAALDRRIAASKADIVLIDDAAAPFAQDLVYNPPWLDRWPVRLAASVMPLAPGDPRICRGKSVATVGTPELASINAFFGQPPPPARWPAAKVREMLTIIGCRETGL